jgi:hypothetical protein
VAKNSTFSGLGGLARQTGRQKMLVLLTATKNVPSKAESFRANARRITGKGGKVFMTTTLPQPASGRGRISGDLFELTW